MPIPQNKTGWKASITAFTAMLALTSPSQAGATAQTESTDAAPIEAGITIHVGGLLFVEGRFDAKINKSDYRLTTNMTTAGVAAKFYPATYKLMSEGTLKQESVEPRRFVSDTKARSDARVVRLTYGKDRVPHLTATPPYDPDDLRDVTPAQQRNTIDPVSAFLLPVKGTETPCARTIPVFDGKRRYNLTFTYQARKKLTPQGATKPLQTVVFTIRYEAIAPIEKTRRFTNTLRRNDDMRIWLAPFDNGRVYLPVRFELPTPIGSAVMQLQNLKTQQVTNLPPLRTRSILSASAQNR
jgi:hypothetical protein